MLRTIIQEFRDDYFFLSNFSPSPLHISGLSFPTVEHAFQACKSYDRHDWVAISKAQTPKEAKALGQRVKLMPGWEDQKEDCMYQLVKLKFTNPYLARKLLLTKNADLIEGNYWHDNYWGICLCGNHDDWGKNKLGHILKRVRKELKDER